MPTDAKLVQAARSGDEKAFETLVEKYRPRIYAAISGFIKNVQDREDIAQETFINAYRNLHQLSQPDRFGYWLVTIAQNQCRDWQRKNRIHTIPIDEVDENLLNSDDSPERKFSQAEQRQIIAQAIQSLPETERQIAQAHYLEGASHHELVNRHGISYQAVCVRLSRAKRKLAKRLEHLLTGVFVTPATTLKQIYSGGLTVMKIGTTPKITIGAIGIIALIFIGFIGSRTLLSPKDNQASSVEAVGQTSDMTAQSVAQTDATRGDDSTTAATEAQRTITEKERQQIKRFFSQFEDPDAQSEADTPQSATASESEIEVISTDTDELLSTTKQSAEDVMNAYVEAYRNFDFEVMLSLKTGTAREVFEEGFERFKRIFSGELPEAEELMNNMMSKGYSEESVNEGLQVILEMWREMYRTAELVSREYVGEEFHFRVRIVVPQRIPKVPKQPESIVRLHKMQKVDGAWQIYHIESSH